MTSRQKKHRRQLAFDNLERRQPTAGNLLAGLAVHAPSAVFADVPDTPQFRVENPAGRHAPGGPAQAIENPVSRAASRGRVDYNGHRVSDATLRNKLQQIADRFGWTISITSGDRSTVPPGGSPTSLHLRRRAADFHVRGVSDERVARTLKSSGLIARDYELIWHGPQTHTGGPHVHLGRNANGRPSEFLKENRGVYSQL